MAVWGLRDNPLYALLKRAWRARGPLAKWTELVSWVPLVLVLCALGYFIGRFLADPLMFATRSLFLGGLILLIAAIFCTWLGMGLYHLAFDALALLGGDRGLGGSDLQLDETVRAARLTDRDFLVALLASLLPRLWLRWLSAPLVMLAGLWLYYGWSVRQENSLGFIISGTCDSATDSMSTLASFSPLTFVWLSLFALPVSIALLFWLIALGRSITVRWQMQLIALSISLMQLAWIPLAVLQALNWATYSGWDERHGWLILVGWVFFPPAVLALLVASLHFSRKLPGARLLLAAGTPALGVVVLAMAVVISTGSRAPLGGFSWYILLNSAVWSMSCFALLNPLLLPFQSMLGAGTVEYFCFSWPRILVVIALQLIILAICAHAARLAIADWRAAED
jgi:hypothetical protein